MVGEGYKYNNISDVQSGFDMSGSRPSVQGNVTEFMAGGKSEKSIHNHSDVFINEIDKQCYRIGCYALVVWALLTALSYALHWESLERLTGAERKAPTLACLFLGMTCVTTVIPIVLKGKKRSHSGVLFAALVVQFIAFLTDFMLAFIPVPICIHPFSGTRIYLLRWCEWSPLAFVMTFLTECCRASPSEIELQDQRNSCGERISHLLSSIREHNAITSINHTANASGDNTSPRGDSDRDLQMEHSLEESRRNRKREVELHVMEDLRPSYVLAYSQGLSTFCGWLFPHLHNVWVHAAVMVISCLLFSKILIRTYERGQALKKMKVSESVGEIELYNWARLSHQLQRTCAILWTVLVICYFFYTFGPMFFTSAVFQTSSLPMMVECVIDVVYKAIYMLIIVDVHDMIFDPKMRAVRRLEELQQMMGVVWENSSDVICISVKGFNGDVSTILSPTYQNIYSKSAANHEVDQIGQQVIAFDLDTTQFDNLSTISDAELQKTKIVPTNVYDLDFGKEHAFSSASANVSEKDDLGSMAQLVSIFIYLVVVLSSEILTDFFTFFTKVIRSWKAKNEGETLVLMHDLKRMDGEKPQPIQCEANISVMEENVLVIVVRDISERFRRFEAEKRVISETTARRKDAAANRFTRHEVKNGLLAAIGLCDSLNEVTGGGVPIEFGPQDSMDLIGLANASMSSSENSGQEPSNRTRNIWELGKTLNEVLDTVLAEAMARDVIHEVYEPKLEKVNLPKILSTTMNPSTNKERKRRFPIITYPNPLPEFSSDPQLWKYIYRNAISNACKYGKIGGKVTTELKWDKVTSLLTLNVINEPGENHRDILAMGDNASSIIFSPIERLKFGASDSYSAGDGAWIMNKCALTLGGECSIKVSFWDFRQLHFAIPYLKSSCYFYSFSSKMIKLFSVFPVRLRFLMQKKQKCSGKLMQLLNCHIIFMELQLTIQRSSEDSWQSSLGLSASPMLEFISSGKKHQKLVGLKTGHRISYLTIPLISSCLSWTKIW